MALAGIERAQVGLYLSGDHEANDLAESLCRIQEADGRALSKQMTKEAIKLIESMHAAKAPHDGTIHYDDWIHNFVTFGQSSAAGDHALKQAQAEILDIQTHLGQLSGAEIIATASRPAGSGK